MDISQQQALDAMRIFLNEYWERGGKESDQIANLLSSLDNFGSQDGLPVDIALWHDWLRACEQAAS